MGGKAASLKSTTSKPKQAQSCDACRLRKIKCTQPSEHSELRGKQHSCKHCLGAKIPCTYVYIPKKRGPPNLYMKKLRDAEIVNQVGGKSDNSHRSVSDRTAPETDEISNDSLNEPSGNSNASVLTPFRLPSSEHSFGTFPTPAGSHNILPYDTDGGAIDPEASGNIPLPASIINHEQYRPTSSFLIHNNTVNQSPNGTTEPVLASMTSMLEQPYTPSSHYRGLPITNPGLTFYPSDGQYPIPTQKLYDMQVPGEPTSARTESTRQVIRTISSSRANLTYGLADNHRTMISPEIGTIHPDNDVRQSRGTGDLNSQASSFTKSLPDPTAHRALLGDFGRIQSPLDAILPRQLLYSIIGLFKDFVYPLTPCVHVPSLIRDLGRRRELEPGQTEWTAMVLATVMSTIVQVPRAFVPLSRSEVIGLAERCHCMTRSWSIKGYPSNITANAVIVRYFDAVYNYVRDRSFASCHTSLLEAQALATVLKLHEEASYISLTPIEGEMRRRIYFLLFCADKSESVLLNRPVKMREEDCATLRLPRELDDEYITETNYYTQPLGITSTITGFNKIIHVYCLIGRIIINWRDDQRNRPTAERLLDRLAEIDDLLMQVMQAMDNCPVEFKLRSDVDSRVQSPSKEFAKDASQVLEELFFDPNASREYARDAFLVQAGNIYVNQQLARFCLLQYREYLLGGSPPVTQASNHPDRSFSNTRNAEIVTTLEFSDCLVMDKESMFYDLLTVLHGIPLQCIAVNGPALVNTVRYIASTLLDTVIMFPSEQDKSGRCPNGLSESVIRAQGYLADFLSVLGDIERHYAWDDPETDV